MTAKKPSVLAQLGRIVREQYDAGYRHGREEGYQSALRDEGIVKTFIFIVHGEDTPVDVRLTEPISAARKMAIAISHNTVRRPEEWAIRDEAGALIDPDTPACTFTESCPRLFLSLKVGFGGCGLRHDSAYESALSEASRLKAQLAE